MSDRPRQSLGKRLADTLFIRRADQTVIALLVLGAIILVAVWYWRSGGFAGRMVDHDELPERQVEFVVNVNTAPAVELAELPGIGTMLAERIIEYRETNGPFEKLEDLRSVKGIGEKTLENMAPHVRLDDTGL